jgi:hypothetical protein
MNVRFFKVTTPFGTSESRGYRIIGLFAQPAEIDPTPADRNRPGRGQRARPDRAERSHSRADRNEPQQHELVAGLQVLFPGGLENRSCGARSMKALLPRTAGPYIRSRCRCDYARIATGLPRTAADLTHRPQVGRVGQERPSPLASQLSTSRPRAQSRTVALKGDGVKQTTFSPPLANDGSAGKFTFASMATRMRCQTSGLSSPIIVGSSSDTVG